MGSLLTAIQVTGDTLSFNSVGAFEGQFTRSVGSGDNQFIETPSAGVLGTRAIQRSANGTETIVYVSNEPLGGLLNAATVSMKLKYSTNSTGKDGVPLFFGLTTNSEFPGFDTNSAGDDFLGVRLNQLIMGSNESKLSIFNGVNGSTVNEVDSAHENLAPGWYEFEVSFEKVDGAFDLSVAMHSLSENGVSRTAENIITAAVSSLANPDLLGSGGLHFYLGGTDSLNRGVEVIDEIVYSGIGDDVDLTGPSALLATVISNSQIDLTWSDNSSDETNFRVERKTGIGSWSAVKTLPAGTTSYSDVSLLGETTYSYRVFALANGVISKSSNQVSARTGSLTPFIPADLIASAFSTTGVRLTWTDTSSNETWFRIERKSGAGAFELVDDIVGDLEGFSDTGLVADTTYTYRIRSGNAAGLSPSSNEASVTTPSVPVPAAPSNFRLTSASVTQVAFAWDDNSNDEQGFRVARKTGSGSFELIAELPAGSTAYSDTEVTELGAYMYHVYGYNGNGQSAFSNPIDIKLPFLAPNGLTAQAVSTSQIDLSWNDNSQVETGYRIERKSGNSSYITLVNVGNDIASFSDMTVSPSTSYVYRVVGISFFEFSDYTNEATASTPALVPSAAPSELAIINMGIDHVILNWNDNSSDELGFRIERKTGNGSFEMLKELDPETTIFGDYDVTELGSYVYRVVSYNAAGGSVPTNEITVQMDFISPTKLSALAVSSERVDLSWLDNSSVETGYLVERKAGEGDFEELVALDAGSVEFTDTEVAPLSTYTYRVTALSGSLRSTSSNDSSVNTPNVPSPGSPSNLLANLIDSKHIALSWIDNSVNELGFRLERKVGNGGWSNFVQLPGNTTSFQDLQVSELETFRYRVVSFNDGGISTPSNEALVTFPFIAPTGLSGQSVSPTEVDLTWTDNSLVETGYRVERKSGDGPFMTLTTTEPGIEAYVDGSANLEVNYTYRVIGEYVGGLSTPSNEVSAATSANESKPNAPTGFSANAVAYDQIHLTWNDDSDNESGFRFERKEGSGGEFRFIGNSATNSTSFTDIGLKPDTTYFYRVSAFINGARASDKSPEKSATTLSIPLPSSPENLTVVSQEIGVVGLSWTDTSDVEAGFTIQRKIGGSNFEDLVSVNENVTFYNDSSVTELKSYTYRVLSYNSGGSSPVSSEVQVAVPLAIPRSFEGEAVSSNSVFLSWEDVSRIESAYRVERKESEGDFETVVLLGANSTEFSDSSVAPKSTYSYRVFAMKEGTVSEATNVINVTTPNIAVPNVPTELRVIALSETSVSITWKDNSDNEDGFQVFRKTEEGGVWVDIGEVVPDVNMFVDDQAISGVNYSYRVSAFNEGGAGEEVETDFIIPVAGRLINISTRGLVESGDNVMIGSFIIQGDGPKTVLIRGIGPSIASSINAPVLNDPELTLVSGADLNRPIAYNDDWRDTDEQRIIDVGLPPSNKLESAIVVQLEPGAYSAILSGVNYTTGFGLIEVYEVDYSKNIRVVNISTRSFVQEGDKRMIGGFIVNGDTPTRVYIRASGPSLPASIENRLADPILELFSGKERIDINDSWQESPRIGEIVATGIAPTNEKEAAIVATLDPGSYTAIVGGANDSVGYSLLEIYYYPE